MDDAKFSQKSLIFLILYSLIVIIWSAFLNWSGISWLRKIISDDIQGVMVSLMIIAGFYLLLKMSNFTLLQKFLYIISVTGWGIIIAALLDAGSYITYFLIAVIILFNFILFWFLKQNYTRIFLISIGIYIISLIIYGLILWVAVAGLSH